MVASIEGRTVQLPDFLIVGANKGGTTSVYYYLRQHPRIFMPLFKEPNFFYFGGAHPPEDMHPKKSKVQIWRFEDYLRLFEDAKEGQVLGEATTAYLTGYQKVIPNIKKFVPGWERIKIVMILREPAARAFSHYMMFRLWGVERLEFEDAIKQYTDYRGRKTRFPRYLGPGYYYEQVKSYLDNFTYVKIYLFDDLKADAPGLIKDLYRFLGVDDSFIPEMETQYNPSGAPWSRLFHKVISTPGIFSSRIPLVKMIPLEKRISLVDKIMRLNIRKRARMNDTTRRYLKELYREDILKLQELIGRDLSGWLR